MPTRRARVMLTQQCDIRVRSGDLINLNRSTVMGKQPPKSSGKRPRRPGKPGEILIFRRFRTTKDGRVLDARNYGLKAWPIWVKA